MRRLFLIILLAGCAAVPASRWEARLDDAVARATREGKPIYVLSVFGDLTKKC